MASLLHLPATGEAGIQLNRIEFSLDASAQTFHEWVGELWTAVLLSEINSLLSFLYFAVLADFLEPHTRNLNSFKECILSST